MNNIKYFRHRFFRRYDSIWNLVAVVLLVVSILVVYAQTGEYEFTKWDDTEYVSENQQIQTGLNFTNLKWAMTTTHAANWHPLTWISHMIDIQLFGLDAGNHHYSSVLIHMLNTILLFFIFNSIINSRWVSVFVVAIFALHPLNVESVAWISERKNVLCTLFWLLTIWSYVRYTRWSSWKNYLITLFLFVLSIMSKPMAVTLPLVLLLMDFWLLRNSFRTSVFNRTGASPFSGKYISIVIMEKLPFFAVSLLSSILTFVVQQNQGAVKIGTPLYIRITNAIQSIFVYIQKLVFPTEFACLYPYPQEFNYLYVTLIFLLIISASVIVIYLRKKTPALITGWFWFLGTLVPVSGIIQVGSQPMADRYMYIPMIGLLLILAVFIKHLSTRFPAYKKYIIAACGVFLLLLGMKSWLQVHYWKNSITLFGHSIEVTKDNYGMYYNMGLALIEAGEYDLAEHCLIRVKQDPYRDIDISYELGCIYGQRGQFEIAEQFFIKALEREPMDADIHNNYGAILLIYERNEEARYHFHKALELDPGHEIAAENLRLLEEK